mmetsp:Transcript_41580/g.120511  ORF Transcript_41580/g.120511 Transcript_41580/m.120511 type:complete len:776 (+) Transcript_41580:59-2386(+)
MQVVVRFIAVLLLQATGGRGSEHDMFQRRSATYTVSQNYIPADDRRGGRRLEHIGDRDQCEEIFESVAMAPLRIGFHMVDVEGLDPVTLQYVESLMHNASNYWGSVLNVRPASQPIFAEYDPEVNLARYVSVDPHDPENLYSGLWRPPTCGPERVPVPDVYLKPRKSCQSFCKLQIDCSACGGGACDCDADAWNADPASYCCQVREGCDACPVGDFNHSNFEARPRTQNGAYAVCMDDCTEYPGGRGLVDKDVMLLVTVDDTRACQNSGTLQAYASSCIFDQCDRPIFGAINFCKSRLRMNETSGVAADTSTAAHEIAHVLGFSSSLYPYFRDSQGKPRVPRHPDNPRRFQNEKRYTCHANGSIDWDEPGASRFIDIVPEIVDFFDERGFSECGCPRSTNDPIVPENCFVKKQVIYEVPSCSIKMVTPAVRQWSRNHFDCPDLEGAELENQDTTDCEVFGSHWEGRLFNGELMAAVHVEGSLSFVSAVTLALFVDSGWYDVNWDKKDELVSDVHWGYQKGCGFARDQTCIANGVASWDEAFCTDPDAEACSLDRLSAAKCSLTRTNIAPPAVFSYFGPELLVGTSSAVDYCPVYGITHSNRICVNQESTPRYRPPSAQREIFGRTSRCFISDLHEFAYSELGIDEGPLCFDTKCSPDGKSYQIGISDDNGGTEWLEPCTRRGEEVRRLGFGGKVVCARPDEICTATYSKHLAGLSSSQIEEAMGVKLVAGYRAVSQAENATADSASGGRMKDSGGRSASPLNLAAVVILAIFASY